MRAAFLAVIGFLLLAGCVSNICPQQLNLTNPIPYNMQPSMMGMTKVYDQSISVKGEVYLLQVWSEGNGTYYVRYEPENFGGRTLYGPFIGNATTDIQCHG